MSRSTSRLGAPANAGMIGQSQFDMRQHTGVDARSSRATPLKIHSPNRLRP